MHLDERGHLPEPYRIVDIRQENPTVRSFVLDGALALDPGRFVMAWLPGLDEKPFSPSAADPLTLTVTRVGPFTTAMHGLQMGDTIWIRGPFGRGFEVCAGALLLIGGGCGAAPLLYLAQSARRIGREVDVVLGARNVDGLFFQRQYAELGCRVHLCTDNGSTGVKATSVQAARDLLERGLVVDALYACGPAPMLDAAYVLARQYSLPDQLSHEAYMRCGIGVCGSCSCGGKLVCRDGPVFRAAGPIPRAAGPIPRAAGPIPRAAGLVFERPPGEAKVEVVHLSARLDAIPLIARWRFEQWGDQILGSSLQAFLDHTRISAQAHGLPQTWISLDGNRVTGAASLSATDMHTRLELSPWLVGVYVDAFDRGRGIGAALVRHVVEQAREMGIETLWLFTPDQERFYQRMGWQAVERTRYRDEDVVIMKIDLRACAR
ncbi:MAG: dihydroorotate dehydrogenase electron transfer subunit [Anaerolineae bacterium]|nr:dihydroorotate dehydrogenase electron transfer subunit [Anaerolineae bacterium]